MRSWLGSCHDNDRFSQDLLFAQLAIAFVRLLPYSLPETSLRFEIEIEEATSR
jgi:hypothetical protein